MPLQWLLRLSGPFPDAGAHQHLINLQSPQPLIPRFNMETRGGVACPGGHRGPALGGTVQAQT